MKTTSPQNDIWHLLPGHFSQPMQSQSTFAFSFSTSSSHVFENDLSKLQKVFSRQKFVSRQKVFFSWLKGIVSQIDWEAKKRKKLWKSKAKMEAQNLWSCWAKWFCLKKKEKERMRVLLATVTKLFYRLFPSIDKNKFWRNFSVFERMKLWTQKNLRIDLQLARVSQNSWKFLPFTNEPRK